MIIITYDEEIGFEGINTIKEYKNNEYKVLKDGGTTTSSSIKIKYGNYEIELDNTKNYK